MIRLYYLILVVVGFSLPISTLAMSVAVVEVVQERAAFQRDGRQQPLTQGTELYSGDIITTGTDARVLIRFPNDNLVRIGAHAQVIFDRIIPPSQKEGLLTGVFKVLKGVFRFTHRSSLPLDIKIQVGDRITAGIRGTDVYTHAQSDKDLVCLIEGKVSVQVDDTTTVLTQAREGFILPKGKPPLPVSKVSEAKFQQWLNNSELQ